MLKILPVLALLVAFTGCTPLWVAPNGLDTNPGTEASPKRTLAGACNAAGTDKIITMKGGTYPEQQITSGCANAQIVESGEAIIRATNPSDTASTLGVHAAGVSVRGITVSSNNLKRKTIHLGEDAAGFEFADGSVGNVADDKAVEVWADDVTLEGNSVQDARLITPGVHTECVFVVGANRLTLRNNTFSGCGVYDVAYTRCKWCTPMGPAPVGGLIEGNDFRLSHQDGGTTWHYNELAFYSHLDGPVQDIDVRNNNFQTAGQNQGCGGQGSPPCGGILLEVGWSGGDRCGNTTDGPAPQRLEAVWRTPC